MSFQDQLLNVRIPFIPRRVDGDQLPLWNRLSYERRSKIQRAVVLSLVGVAIAIVVLPVFWMFLTSFTPRSSLTQAHIIPDSLTTAHYRSVFGESQYFTWYTNTLIVAGGVVFLTTVASTLGGYALARVDIPRKRTFARGILFGYMFPPILLAIPMFIFWRELGIINSLVGLILAETALSLPFSLWLMWQIFQTVPYSLEESARMAGATRFRAFVDVALPMAKPGMVAVGVFSFAIAWNQFTIPEVLMVESKNWVIVQGIYSFSRQDTILWGEVMAASFLALIPSFLFVFFLQKYLLRGFESGGVG